MPRRRFTCLVVLTASLVAGCGGSGAGTGSSQPSVPAQVPTGPDARTVTYSCVEGRSGTISVAIPTSAQLAEVMNEINVCEFDGGLGELSVELPCPQGLSTISVTVEANQISDQAVTDACAIGS